VNDRRRYRARITSKKVPISVRVSPELKVFLEGVASKQERSVTNIVERMLREHIAEPKYTERNPEEVATKLTF
jgi:hypothetical protein